MAQDAEKLGNRFTVPEKIPEQIRCGDRRLPGDSSWDAGFSLVELIIVIAIAAILTGASASYFGNMKTANMDKAVEAVDSSLNQLQTHTMGKAGTSYLYIYAIDDCCYVKESGEKLDAYNGEVLDKDGTKLGGASLKVYYNDADTASRQQVANGKYITIAYTKASTFSDVTNATDIIFDNGLTKTITLMHDTGKHRVHN